MPSIFNALIRTHHITSRKKLAALRKAASNNAVYALMCSGGCPGIMYCEGDEDGVKEWVGIVQRLRYKDFQLVKKPAELENLQGQSHLRKALVLGKMEEVESVKEFGARMDALGLWDWWRRGMGYTKEK